MKYRIIGISAAAVLMVLTAVLLKLDSTNPKNRIHQHLTARQPDAGCDCDGSELCTHLPLVIIDTEGQEIPGENIEESIVPETGEYNEFTLGPDGSSTIPCSIKVMDSSVSNNHPSDEAELESYGRIRIRGNTSRLFDKKGYLLTTTKEDYQTSQDLQMLGMSSHHEWALHGPFMDKSLIRNYMWYNISGEIMDYAPNVRFCEVILNGEYLGLYVMVETITNGEGGRLNMTLPDNDYQTQISYAIRLDRGSSNPIKNVDTFTTYAYRNRHVLEIVYPGAGGLSTERVDFITNDFSNFEKSLYSYDYDTEPYAYWNYADMDSFAEYFILNEFICNYEVGARSTYIYKDLKGKFKMCMWDLNTVCGNMVADTTMHFEMQYLTWFYMLCKDEKFVDRIIDRYRELRQTYLSDEYLLGYIDDVIEYLGPAIDRNFEVWGYTFEEYLPLIPEERNPEDYEEAVNQMKDFIVERGAWMDENIEILKQYCHESKVKKFNH